MKLGEKLQALVLAGKARQQFEPSKNAIRRQHFTASAEVEETHYTLPKWCHRRLRGITGDFYYEKYAQYAKEYGVARKYTFKRGRFLIGQYLDRSKYAGDGSKKT